MNGTSSSNLAKITMLATSALWSNLVVGNVKLVAYATEYLAGAVTNSSPGNKISPTGTYCVSATSGSGYNPVTVVAS